MNNKKFILAKILYGIACITTFLITVEIMSYALSPKGVPPFVIATYAANCAFLFVVYINYYWQKANNLRKKKQDLEILEKYAKRERKLEEEENNKKGNRRKKSSL